MMLLVAFFRGSDHEEHEAHEEKQERRLVSFINNVTKVRRTVLPQ
jgi:hypothetical protein